MGGGVGSQNDHGDNSCYCCRSILSDSEMDYLKCGPDVLSLGGITADYLSLLFCGKERMAKQVDSQMEGMELLDAGVNLRWTV